MLTTILVIAAFFAGLAAPSIYRWELNRTLGPAVPNVDNKRTPGPTITVLDMNYLVWRILEYVEKAGVTLPFQTPEDRQKFYTSQMNVIEPFKGYSATIIEAFYGQNRWKGTHGNHG